MNKQQLANRIWASANNMRNKIDANEYKDYILGLIFYKFLSDTEVKYFIEDCEWEEDELVELVENYEDMNMKNAIAECQEHIGFFIEYKYLFNTWLTDTEFSVATLSEALSNFERLMSENFASVYAGIFKTLREGLSKLGDNPSAQTKALKAIDELFGRKKVNIIDKHVNSGNLSVKFEVFLKKIYYMIHGEEMRPSGDSNKVTLSTCIFAFDCLKRLRYSPRETEQKLSGYLNLIRNNCNTSEGNGAHASYLLTEAQLDENIKAFATLYLYVTGMCYDELKAKYDI